MAEFQQKRQDFKLKKRRQKPIPVVILKKRRTITKQRTQDYSIDYKNIELLTNFMSRQAKILSRRATGLSTKKQRHIANAIKRARMSSLLPFVNLEASFEQKDQKKFQRKIEQKNFYKKNYKKTV